jgi:hypothetical protein
MSKKEQRRDIMAEDRVFFGALLGVDIVSVTQLLSQTQLDTFLTIALYLFAIAIPIVGSYVCCLVLSSQYRHVPEVWYHFWMMIIGASCSVFGITALFYHFSLGMGSTFILFCASAAWLCIHYITRLNKANPSE